MKTILIVLFILGSVRGQEEKKSEEYAIIAPNGGAILAASAPGKRSEPKTPLRSPRCIHAMSN